MTLHDFERRIHAVVLERGRRYFKDGHVMSLSFEDGEWVADVEGSEDYTVIVRLDDAGAILESGCDCPYDQGEYCKHQVAVFYALRGETGKPKQDEKPQEKSLKSILEEQGKDALVSALLEYAKQDKHLKDDLRLRFSPIGDKPGYAQKLIQNAIGRVMSRGYVQYRDVRDAVRGADAALEMAEEEQQNAPSCIAICIVILREMMELISCCDDSNGTVGGVICETFELIADVLEELSVDDPATEEVFHLVLNHAREKIYEGWTDWQFELLYACVPLCKLPHRREAFEASLSAFESADKDDFSVSYTAWRVQKLRHELIATFDGTAAAERYMENNLSNSDFREAVIQKALKRRQLDRALTLCLEGEQANANYAGLVSKWAHIRYGIYEQQGDVEAQKKLAAAFVLGGEFAYYKKLKALYDPAQWHDVMQSLLNDLGTGWRGRETYIQILIHEKLKARLMDLCKKNTADVERLYPHLLPEYKEDVGAIFMQHIRAMARLASDRSGYHQVCQRITLYKKACGAKPAAAIKEELQTTYPKRPAFLDELGKLK